jgi:hypothetical protein
MRIRVNYSKMVACCPDPKGLVKLLKRGKQGEDHSDPHFDGEALALCFG